MKTRKGKGFSLEGRGIAIAVIAVVSGAFFALGFFVGQATVGSPLAEEAAVAQSEFERIDEPPAPLAEAPEESKAMASAPAEEPGAQTAQAVAAEPPSKGLPTLYSVQVAAYQNRRDAEAMQLSFKKKGYPVYIYRVVTKERQVIYKVRIGKFSDQQEAERLAIKLKTEGIASFVTSL